MTESRLTEQQAAAALEMLQRDVHVSVVKDRLGLDDADILYDVTYDSNFRNRTTIATEKYGRSLARRSLDVPYRAIIRQIESLHAERGALRILEQGFGNGQFAHQISSQFPDCRVDAIDLSAVAVKAAREKYGRDNLTYWQADGYGLWRDHEQEYDVVVHANVLEHVPDKERYLESSLRMLKQDGMLIFSFPSEGYWRFWGTPKYLLCRLLGKPFETHACDDEKVERFLRSRECAILWNQHLILCLPRRLYYYVPEPVLEMVGRSLENLETEIGQAGWFAPMMFSVYAVCREATSAHKIKEPPPACHRPLRFRSVVGLGALWLVSSTLMTWEVVAGRRTVFRQD